MTTDFFKNITYSEIFFNIILVIVIWFFLYSVGTIIIPIVWLFLIFFALLFYYIKFKRMNFKAFMYSLFFPLIILFNLYI
jgi:hypothetical protein